jgi:hypothetical protein
MKGLCANIIVVLPLNLFSPHSSCGIIKAKTEGYLMSNHSDVLRQKYIKNPPEGLTAKDIRNMSDEDLLDMDYFLHEDDDLFEDQPGAEGFYLF